MIESDSQFGAFKQPGIMCSNIVFPFKSLIEKEKRAKSKSPGSNISNSEKTPEEFNLIDYIGDSGFNNVAKKERDGERVIYSINPRKNIFLEENLPNFSAKISNLFKTLRIVKESYLFILSLSIVVLFQLHLPLNTQVIQNMEVVF